MVSRHEFLSSLHNLLRPEVYLEIGVQYGHSLALAGGSRIAIGIDPAPLVTQVGNQSIFPMTSNDYFETQPDIEVDLAFIDGLHQYEQAARDFCNVMTLIHERSVVVFDDVLPTTQAMASRTIVPGDWTGDVWKVEPWLAREDICTLLVDTFPTGLLLCWNFNGPELPSMFPWVDTDTPVPDDVLTRKRAVSAELALQTLRRWWENE